MFTIGLLLPQPGPAPPPDQQPNIILIFQAAAHGTDISTGNQPGIPSLPPAGATPDAGNTNSPSPLCPPPEGSQSYCQDNTNQAGQSGGQGGGHQFSNPGMFSSYQGLAGLAGGHDRNHNTQGLGQTELGLPYKEAYQGYSEQQHQQPPPPAVK